MANMDIAAAIVAGGQATRFGGRDKSRVLIGGQSIISRQVAVLQPLTGDLFIVASQRERFAGLPWRVCPDVLPGTGVAGAILTALESTSADRVIVVACDLPFLHGGLLRRLLDLAAGADGAWVQTPAGAEPLLACYRRHASSRIRAAIEAGRRKASDLDQILTMRIVDLVELSTFGDPSRLLANVNSPEDLSTIDHS
jgi:molybdopterin-guanine dinucleotide biosynthesis protein A